MRNAPSTPLDQQGEGSTFTLELPLRAPDTSARAAAPWTGSVIVVVDDEMTAVDATTAALAPLHCTVTADASPRVGFRRRYEPPLGSTGGGFGAEGLADGSSLLLQQPALQPVKQ